MLLEVMFDAVGAPSCRRLVSSCDRQEGSELLKVTQ